MVLLAVIRILMCYLYIHSCLCSGTALRLALGKCFSFGATAVCGVLLNYYLQSETSNTSVRREYNCNALTILDRKYQL
uniref:Uncharacterized protein n=1 Tax=Arundo donax TaxID=35708 RepID=A0A0A9G5S3_ARUDO